MNCCFDLNTDANTRDQIIFGEDYDESKYLGGTRSFKELSLEQLNKLIDNNYIKKEDAQNASPEIGDFWEFMSNNKHLPYKLGGYTVSTNRVDYRTSIDEIYLNDTSVASKEDVYAFVKFARYADEFNANDDCFRAWWD